MAARNLEAGMSDGALLAGLVGAAIAGGFVLVARVTIRDTDAVRARYAREFASRTGVSVPAELMMWVGGKVRHKKLMILAATWPVGVVPIFWLFYQEFQEISSHRQPSPLAFGVPVLVPLGASALITAFVQVSARRRELDRAQAQGLVLGPWTEPLLASQLPRSGRRLTEPRIWLARVIALVPLAAVVGVSTRLVDDSFLRSRLWELAVSAVLSIAGLIVAESVQASIAQGPRIGNSAVELAVDDAFASEAALDVAQAAVGLTMMSLSAALWLFANPQALVFPHGSFDAKLLFFSLPAMAVVQAAFSLPVQWTPARPEARPDPSILDIGN
jgi:hypothetical protein